MRLKYIDKFGNEKDVTIDEQDKTYSDGFEIGCGNIYFGNVPPEGWMFCNGDSLQTSEYPDLYKVIGNTYGGDSEIFNLPNLNGRVPIGATKDNLGITGGEKTHTLTSSEMPKHKHDVPSLSGLTNTTGAHTHTYQDYYRSGTANGKDLALRTVGNSSATSHSGYYTEYSGAHTHSAKTGAIETTEVGSNAAHNNLQPYIVCNYIIKVGNKVVPKYGDYITLSKSEYQELIDYTYEYILKGN